MVSWLEIEGCFGTNLANYNKVVFATCWDAVNYDVFDLPDQFVERF